MTGGGAMKRFPRLPCPESPSEAVTMRKMTTALIGSFLLLLPLTGTLALVPAAAAEARAQGQPATKMAVGETVHFTMDKGEQKDFAIQLGKGAYYIVWDLKRADEKPSNIIAHVDLLKTNGTMITPRFLSVNQIHTIARTGVKFSQARPLAARLRVTSEYAPLEIWMRVVPVAKMGFAPFPTGNAEIKPLAVGTDAGKGGTLEPHEWAYHAVTLTPGKYDVSLYMKTPDGESTNIQGQIDQLDPYGFIISNWEVRMNEIAREARKEERLVITKPRKVYLRVTNNQDKPRDYIVGIEKAKD